MAPEPGKDAHEGGYSQYMKAVGWSILAMGISLAAVIGVWMWFGHIGPSFSAGIMEEQQETLRKDYGLPSQQTSTAELEVPPSLRGLENATGNATTTSAASNATTSGSNNQTATAAGNATTSAGNNNQTSSAAAGNNQTTAAGNATGAAPSGGGGGGTTAVSIVQGAASKTNDAFDPNPVQTKAGGTVTWTNDDSTPHTVTSGQDSKPDGKFDSGILDQGKSFSFTFEQAGEYPYFCTLHPNMVGTVSVS
jgi:plastocyanin